MPFFRVVVGAGHHNFDLFSPVGTEFKNPVVDANSNRSGEGNDHSLAGELILAVLLIVLEDIADQRVNGLRSAEDLFQMRHLMHTLLDLLWSSPFVSKDLIFSIYGPDCSLVELQIYYAGFVEHRASGAILYGLGHVIDVDIVTEDFLRVTVPI